MDHILVRVFYHDRVNNKPNHSLRNRS